MFPTLYYVHPIPFFGQLDELLIVEDHYRDDFLNRCEGLWLSTPEAICGNTLIVTLLMYSVPLSWKYGNAIKEYQKATKTYGRGFFDEVARTRDGLERYRDLIIGKGNKESTFQMCVS